MKNDVQNSNRKQGMMQKQSLFTYRKRYRKANSLAKRTEIERIALSNLPDQYRKDFSDWKERFDRTSHKVLA